MNKPFVIAVGGPDYGGKSTFCRRATEMLAAAGYKAETYGFPSTAPTGLAARESIRAFEPTSVQAEKLIKDFKAHLNTFGQSKADVIFLDHFAVSTIMHQGEEGKRAVFQSGVLRHNYAPKLYVEITCDYDTAIERAAQRRKERGEIWDDVLTEKYMGSLEAWKRLEETSEFAHRIITNDGDTYEWMRLNCHWASSDVLKLVLKLANTFEHERQPA